MSELWSITIPGYTTGVATVALVAVAAVGVARDRRRNRQSALRDARKVFGTTSEDRPLGGVTIQVYRPTERPQYGSPRPT
jgi:hypothetical protein